MINQRQKWSLILPIINVALAVILLWVGDHQSRAVTSEWKITDNGGEFIPAIHRSLPPATQIAYAINFPALLLASPLRLLGISGVPATLLFLLGVVIVWYIVGQIVDRRLSWAAERKSLALLVSIVGLLGAAAGIWSASRAVGVHYVVPPIGALLWALALAAVCLVVMRKAILMRPTP